MFHNPIENSDIHVQLNSANCKFENSYITKTQVLTAAAVEWLFLDIGRFVFFVLNFCNLKIV